MENLRRGERIGLNDEGGAEYQYEVLYVVNGDDKGYSGLYDFRPLDGGKVERLGFDEWREALVGGRGRPIPTPL